MSVSRLLDDWPLPRCTERCRQVVARDARTGERVLLAVHDVAGHEDALRAEIERARHDLSFGALVVSPSQMRAWVDGREVVLTRTETLILIYLAERHGRLVPYQEIIDHVWGPDYAIYLPRKDSDGLHVLRVNVGRIRHKLGEAGRLIQTHFMFGLSMPRAEQATDDGLPASVTIVTLAQRPLQRCLALTMVERPCRWFSLPALLVAARRETRTRTAGQVRVALQRLADTMEGVEVQHDQDGLVFAARSMLDCITLRRTP